MGEENNIQKECPICHKKFENEFALNGHLRLMKDEAHVAFRQASNIKEEKLVEPASLTTPFAGTKLLDRITDLVKDQEKQYTTQAEQDAFFIRLEDFVTRERENDTKQREKDFQAGCDYMAKEYKECLIPSRLEQMKEEVITTLTEESEVKTEQKLNEMKKNCEHDTDILIRDIKLLKNGKIYIECPWCPKPVLVEQNSQVHFEIYTLMRQGRLGHPECVKRNLPDLAHYWDWKYYNDYQRFHPSKQS